MIGRGIEDFGDDDNVLYLDLHDDFKYVYIFQFLSSTLFYTRGFLAGRFLQ